jgi:hypothetical protein
MPKSPVRPWQPDSNKFASGKLGAVQSLCQRCHLIHDRPHHLAQRRITYMLRRALGDLFLGPYPLDRRF